MWQVRGQSAGLRAQQRRGPSHRDADVTSGNSKATQKPPKSHSKATQKALKRHSKGAFKPLKSHSKNTQKSLKSHSKATQKSLKKPLKSHSKATQEPLRYHDSKAAGPAAGPGPRCSASAGRAAVERDCRSGPRGPTRRPLGQVRPVTESEGRAQTMSK